MKDKKIRHELKQVAGFIEADSKVIELGCGDGELLSYLVHDKNVDGCGIELEDADVALCVQRGLMVIQGDIDKDLVHYPDKCFDYAVSSEVLQATYNPKEVLQQMLRIAGKVVIAIPNFGHWRNRLYLVFKGKMPVTKTLSYQWYETPNIHFCTIKDFELLCKMIGAKIEKQVYLDSKGDVITSCPLKMFNNFFAERVVYLLSL